jgi:hypothetical protein
VFVHCNKTPPEQAKFLILNKKLNLVKDLQNPFTILFVVKSGPAADNSASFPGECHAKETHVGP